MWEIGLTNNLPEQLLLAILKRVKQIAVQMFTYVIFGRRGRVCKTLIMHIIVECFLTAVSRKVMMQDVKNN